MLAIGIIVSLVLFQASAPNVALITTTYQHNNETITLPANGGSLTLVGQAVSNVIVTNRTSGAVVPSTNYTILNDYLNNGVLEARINTTNSLYASNSVNISYLSEPFGYATDGGTRAITNLILILSAIAVFVFVAFKVNQDLEIFG